MNVMTWNLQIDKRRRRRRRRWRFDISSERTKEQDDIKTVEEE